MFGLLITGDFMKLTGVTRNTLIHYDNLGLLKPVKTNGRGDRFYHPFQWYTIIFIKTFQSAGISLESIKKYFMESDLAENGDEFLSRAPGLGMVGKKLYESYKELNKSCRYLDKMVYVNEFFDMFKPGDEPKVIRPKLIGGLTMNLLDNELTMRSPGYYAECNRHIYEQYGKLRDGSFPIITHFRMNEFAEGKNIVYALSSYTLGDSKWPLRKLADSEFVVIRVLGDANDAIKALDKIRDLMNREHYVLTHNISMATNIFAFDENRRRVGDRMIFAPVKKVDKNSFVKYEMNDPNLTFSNTFESGKESSHLLSSGEFIKLCGITRNTLNHYQQHGLIEPEYVRENGYKYYGISQVAALINIKCLKQAGFSIEQIKTSYQGHVWDRDYLSKRVEILKAQKERIYEKLMEQADALSYLKELSGLFLQMSGERVGMGHMAYMERKRYMRKLPFGPETIKGKNGFGAEILKAIRNGQESSELYEYPIGMIIDESCEFSTINSVNAVNPKYKREDDMVVEGKYIVYMISCGSKRYTEEIREVLDDARSSGLKIRGDILTLFMMIKQRSEEEVEMQSAIMVPVE